MYVLKGRQVIAEVKGDSTAPVVTSAHWADNDHDLTVEEVDALLTECVDEIEAAASDYELYRASARDRRGA